MVDTYARMQGLGDRLHVFVGPDCYQVDLDEL
jgi:hypothetical protein